MNTVSRFFLALGLAAVAAAARADAVLTVADFDAATPDTFSFKDERGSVFAVSPAYRDEANKKGNHLGIRYDIQPGGYGGWGVALRGGGVSGYRYLAFDLKGEKGGELFEIGLRDMKSQERRRSIAQFTDTPKRWQRVYIPLTEFNGVNLATLENLSVTFAPKQNGKVFLDNIAFEGAAESAGAEAALGNKLVVDGFDRTNPDQAYRTFAGDSSQLTLASSRILFDGDYSMEMQYRLVTDRPWGSWVSALRQPDQPLNWSGLDEIKIWVKGDGGDNFFRFRFTESDGEIWEFVDKKALSGTRWVLVPMPVREFKIVGQPPKDTPPDLSGVKSFELGIVSPASSQSAGGKTSAGRVWVDLLYVTGSALKAPGVVPAAAPAPAGAAVAAAAPAVRPQGLAAGNVDFSLLAFTEYFFSPETKSQVNHYAKLITTGKLGKFSARVEIGSQSQEFGQASAFVGTSEEATVNRFAALEMPSYQVFVTNVHPQITLMTLGNQFIDYGVDVFAPVFGFKGLSGEGDWERFNYHAFVLKHSLNGFTGGGRVVYFLPDWQFKGQVVYWEHNAKNAAASQVNGGQLEPPEDTGVLSLERVAQDAVYTVNATGRLWDHRLRLEGLYGYNDYRQSATADYTDPFNPIFTAPLDPVIKTGGPLVRLKAETDGWPWRGLSLSYSWRDIGTGYKPHYRQTPEFYDDTDSDQFGHNVIVIQRRGGWVVSGEIDRMKRHSNSDYYRNKAKWGVGYYGYRGMDVSVTQDVRREIYKFTSDRSIFTTDKNDKIIGTEIYVRAQMSSRVAGWVKPRQERIWHPASNNNFTLDSLQARLEYYIANNAKLFADHKITRYDNPAGEPQGFPYDDNFTRVSFEVTF